MLSLSEKQNISKQVLNYFNKAKIALTDEEKSKLEITDFGLNDFFTIGLSTIVYVHTSRCSAEEMVLFPYQICPEHYHPPFENNIGKEETFRCRFGEVYLYVSGEPCRKEDFKAILPKRHGEYFTVFHQIVLKPGEQYTLAPNTLHWFQAGSEGAIVSEFSTQARDDLDIFTDPKIRRFG